MCLGAVVALVGDACHVASGTTRYLWDDVPVVWRSAIWFPVLVSTAVLGMAAAGRALADRYPPVRLRTRRDVLPAAAAVTALYALTAALKDQSDTVSVALVASVAVVVWGVWDPSLGAAIAGGVAAVLGPLAEIAIVAVGASEYTPGSDSLAGVAPWLPALYFAAGAVAFRLWPALEHSVPGDGESQP